MEHLFTLNSQTLDSEIALKYSQMKFGGAEAISFFAQALLEKIKSKLEQNLDKPVLTHVPSVIRETGIHYVVESLASYLQLPSRELTKSTPTQDYTRKNAEERFQLAKNVIEAKEVDFKDQDVVLVDDSWVTGTLMRATIEKLRGVGAQEIQTYTLVKLETETASDEWLLDTAIVRMQGINSLLELVNAESYQFTNYIVTYLITLEEKDLRELLAQIRPVLRSHIAQLIDRMPHPIADRGALLRQVLLEYN